MNKMMEVSIPGRGTKQIPKVGNYGVMFRRVFRAFYPELPCPKKLSLQFYPTRLIIDGTDETWYKHSSLGWTGDRELFLVKLAAEHLKKELGL